MTVTSPFAVFLLQVLLLLLVLLSSTSQAYGFVVVEPVKKPTLSRSTGFLFMTANGDSDATIIPVQEETQDSDYDGIPLNPKAVALKKELMELSQRTQKGFRATASERKKARDIIFELARYNPTAEPAMPYYSSTDKSNNNNNNNKRGGTEGAISPSPPTLAGKWNLIYTDAPDITGLDTSRNPFSTAKLGRIGQECNPPYIKNVIEWLRPDWAKNLNLPFSGSDESRILQKVVTSASANPKKPFLVDLKVAGLELESGTTTTTTTTFDNDNNNGGSSSNDFLGQIEKQGIPAGLLSLNPIDLKGPLNPPFGQFEILYLDKELRIVRTGQNYLAANLRIKEGEEWF